MAQIVSNGQVLDVSSGITERYPISLQELQALRPDSQMPMSGCAQIKRPTSSHPTAI
jgi:hypothetical protein